MTARRIIVTAMALTALGGGSLNAEVQPHGLFCDHMVLQQGLRAPVWGTAAPGEEVTVSIAGQTARAKADAGGSWMARLNPMDAGGPYEMTIAGTNAVTISDVMVGEVWLCSGQSNMGMEVREAMNGEQEIAAASYPNMRLFDVPPRILEEPSRDVRARWRQCSPQSVARFSAAGYYFGRRLHADLGVPIGLICGAQGSSSAEAWVEMSALKEADIEDPVAVWNAEVAYEQKFRDKYEAEMAVWKPAAEKAKAAGEEPPPKPELAYFVGRSRVHQPATLWNGTIAPLVPYGIRGVIWYQGESNEPRGGEYGKLLPALIRSWRKEWGQGDFAFLIVALAPYRPIYDHPTDSGWAEVVEGQWTTARDDPLSGLAVTTDIGDAENAHPANKQEVGRRLALIALAKVYGQDIVCSGPVFASMERDGTRLRLHFDHVHAGLTTMPEGPLKGFAIAGEDRQFVWAEAKIEGDTVVVWSDKVAEPVAVRYAWAKHPICNLANADGLPAVPFRTDDWAKTTGGR
jgi:sialate O-acetylesterase